MNKRKIIVLLKSQIKPIEMDNIVCNFTLESDNFAGCCQCFINSEGIVYIYPIIWIKRIEESMSNLETDTENKNIINTVESIINNKIVGFEASVQDLNSSEPYESMIISNLYLKSVIISLLKKHEGDFLYEKFPVANLFRIILTPLIEKS